MQEPKVFVIVVNWNRAADTIECVRSLLGLAYSNCEVVVVDNASSDGSVARLKKAFPAVSILLNAENLGYAEGNNVGIRHALSRGADYILLLNNDTIVAKELVGDLVRAMQGERQAGIVAPKIYYLGEPTRVWFAGALIDWATGESPHIGIGEYDTGQFDQVLEVDRVTGCAMMVTREVFDRIGLLDPRYFLYYEDVDFCVRASKRGFRSYCVQNAKVWHKESASTKANEGSALHSYYHTRNRLLFWREHLGIPADVHRHNRVFMREYLRWLVGGSARLPISAADSPRFWALLDYYCGRFGMRPKYHRYPGA